MTTSATTSPADGGQVTAASGRGTTAGMTATAEIFTGTLPEGILVPNAALQWKPRPEWIATATPELADGVKQRGRALLAAEQAVSA